MTIRRFSSRTQRLDVSFLLRHLRGARSYMRIAGYFTSSLFEVAGEVLEDIPDVRIVCNVDIHPDDLKVAQLRESRMLGRWNERAGGRNAAAPGAVPPSGCLSAKARSGRPRGPG